MENIIPLLASTRHYYSFTVNGKSSVYLCQTVKKYYHGTINYFITTSNRSNHATLPSDSVKWVLQEN